MVFKVFNVKDYTVVAEFYSRLDAQTYIASNDPSAEYLFYSSFTTKEDLPLYSLFVSILTFINNMGVTHCC